jgi:hypothetical protein
MAELPPPAEAPAPVVVKKEKPKGAKKIIWVKKNLIDPTAAFSYALGVSIVHAALAVTLLFVKRADMEKAKQFHVIC